MENDKRLRTGCTLLDLVVGGGQGLGFPTGKVINIVGDKSSGKTFLACEITAKNYHSYKKNFKHNFDDGENGLTFDTQSLYGFPITDENTLRSHTVEEWDSNVRRFLNKMGKNDVGIYTMDSLDGLSNDDIEERSEERFKKSEAGKEFTDGTYGVATPKFLSQEFFRTKTRELEETNTLLIIISQVRQNLEKFSFKKWTRSGGKALDFYAHTVLWLANVKTIEKQDRAVGVILNAKADKSKTPRPYRECHFIVYFDYGIDNIGSNVDYLFDLRIGDSNGVKTYTGNLNKNKAQNIRWKGKEPDFEGVKEFLEANKVYDEARGNKKGKPALQDLLDWIDSNEELKKKFNEIFGQTITRTELIDMILDKGKNPGMEQELEDRVIAKWESVEQAIKTERKGKYE